MSMAIDKSPHKPNTYFKSDEQRNRPFSFCSPTPKRSLLFLFLAIGGVTLLALLENQTLPIASLSTWSFWQQWQTSIINKTLPLPNCTHRQLQLEYSSMAQKLRDSVTFLPLKDYRFGNKPLDGHTWFMSSFYDTREGAGQVQHLYFPSESTKNRLLCLKGRDTHDGSWNYYALAWPEALPSNATLMKGLTFISYNHYDFDNIWHGLSSTVPFVAWHIDNGCQNSTTPARWILYHWGELRFNMASWLQVLMEATFGHPTYIERFNGVESDDQPVCFEKAVVMRHNEGGMSNERRMKVYDLLRCKARVYCNVSVERKTSTDIGMTLFMRTGARSFRNETAVIRIFEKECNKVEGCRLTVAHSNNLTICQQVKLMSLTDILVSPHGAQLTNIFLMDRNSSVLEFYPKGWLELAGVGQYVYLWLAGWSGMRHQGAWRDPYGENCPYPISNDNDRLRCFLFYKDGRIGYNETYFAQWAANVLSEVKTSKFQEASKPGPGNTTCDCG